MPKILAEPRDWLVDRSEFGKTGSPLWVRVDRDNLAGVSERYAARLQHVAVRHARSKLGRYWPHKEFAEAAGCSRQRAGMILRGQQPMTMIDFASIAVLFGWDRQNYPPLHDLELREA